MIEGATQSVSPHHEPLANTQRPIRIGLRWGFKSQHWNKINKQEMIETNVIAVDISAGIQRVLTCSTHFVMSKTGQMSLQQSTNKSEPGRSFRLDRKITRLNKQLKSLTKLIKHETDKSANEQLLNSEIQCCKIKEMQETEQRRKKKLLAWKEFWRSLDKKEK
jgi:hypothetical protein